ncbi:MAG: hypothetical protein AB1899_05265 [Pseudomonadota bacterium]
MADRAESESAELAEGRDEASPEADSAGGTAARFVSWPLFLFVAIGVNALYLWGMLAQMGHAVADPWTKALAWLPFNFIATVLYFAFYVKLGRGRAGAIFALLCVAMIALNWIVFFAA